MFLGVSFFLLGVFSVPQLLAILPGVLLLLLAGCVDALSFFYFTAPPFEMLVISLVTRPVSMLLF